VLHHRSHLNASAVIKNLPEAGVTFVVLRKADPTQDLGSRPVSQFPTGLEENPIERYTRYRGLRQVITHHALTLSLLYHAYGGKNPVFIGKRGKRKENE
jgi:hypothetical protein